MNPTLQRILIASLATALLAGCKIKITVPEGGQVVTQTRAIECAEGDSCSVDVVDVFFSETFVAIPEPGWVFDGWKKARRHLCGGSRSTCALTTTGFPGNETLMSALESDQEFFLEPVFVEGSKSNIGRWVGEWTNIRYGSTGALRMTATDLGNNQIELTIDIDGVVGGLLDPEPQTIVATQKANGDISFDGTVDAAGDDAALVFTLTKNGELSISMPDLPVPGFDRFEGSGTMGGGVAFLDYTVYFSPAGSATGSAAATRK